MRDLGRYPWLWDMEPEPVVRREIDVVAQSRLLRGLVLAMSHADENDGIGLTKAGAMNRRFVHRAAETFAWPGYTAKGLFVVNKVLNEVDMPPLGPVRDLLLHLKLMRRYKGALQLTRRGRDPMACPGALFDLAAPISPYRYVHDDRAQDDGGVLGNWRVFLNVVNIEARTGCTTAQPMKTFHGWNSDDRADPDYRKTRFAPRSRIIRPLCWPGLLWEDRQDLNFFDEGTSCKAPLRTAALSLVSDTQAGLRLT